MGLTGRFKAKKKRCENTTVLHCLAVDNFDLTRKKNITSLLTVMSALFKIGTTSSSKYCVAVIFLTSSAVRTIFFSFNVSVFDIGSKQRYLNL